LELDEPADFDPAYFAPDGLNALLSQRAKVLVEE
jgi:hypothetical protein